jgi:hypothetical protein
MRFLLIQAMRLLGPRFEDDKFIGIPIYAAQEHAKLLPQPTIGGQVCLDEVDRLRVDLQDVRQLVNEPLRHQPPHWTRSTQPSDFGDLGRSSVTMVPDI